MAIVQAPGDDCAWMVRSSSSKRPHYVKVSKCSFICDDQCLSYKSTKVCSHTIAIAIKQESIEKFVKWYRTLKHTPNFSTLAEAGKPATAGKKPGRKGMSKKSSQQIKKFIVDAEEAGLEWQSRGEEQLSTHDSLDVLEDPVLSIESEQSQTSAVTTLLQYQMSTSPQYHQPSTAQQRYQASTGPQYYQAYTGPHASAGAEHYQASTGQQHHQMSTGYQASSGPQHYNTSTGSYASTALFVSHRDVQNINIGSITGPPPLIPTPSEGLPLYHSPSSSFSPIMSSQSISEPGPSAILTQKQRPSVGSPFGVTFTFGNVSRCNGDKGRIFRDENKKLLPPPDDIAFGHKEHVVFHNQRSGVFEQSRDKRNVYYHPWKKCIAPHFSDFNSKKHIVIQESVKAKLLHVHKEFILNEFGIVL